MGNLRSLLSFDGRATRKEFLLVAGPLVLLEVVLVAALYRYMPEGLRGNVLFWPVALAFFGLPALALPTFVRRLHDLGRNGIWLFVVTFGLRVITTITNWLGFAWMETGIYALGFGLGLLFLASARGEEGQNSYGPCRILDHGTSR